MMIDMNEMKRQRGGAWGMLENKMKAKIGYQYTAKCAKDLNSIPVGKWGRVGS